MNQSRGPRETVKVSWGEEEPRSGSRRSGAVDCASAACDDEILADLHVLEERLDGLNEFHVASILYKVGCR